MVDNNAGTPRKPNSLETHQARSALHISNYGYNTKSDINTCMKYSIRRSAFAEFGKCMNISS